MIESMEEHSENVRTIKKNSVVSASSELQRRDQETGKLAGVTEAVAEAEGDDADDNTAFGRLLRRIGQDQVAPRTGLYFADWADLTCKLNKGMRINGWRVIRWKNHYGVAVVSILGGNHLAVFLQVQFQKASYST